jgi:hypothetical protein
MKRLCRSESRRRMPRMGQRLGEKGTARLPAPLASLEFSLRLLRADGVGTAARTLEAAAFSLARPLKPRYDGTAIASRTGHERSRRTARRPSA